MDVKASAAHDTFGSSIGRTFRSSLFTLARGEL